MSFYHASVPNEAPERGIKLSNILIYAEIQCPPPDHVCSYRNVCRLLCFFLYEAASSTDLLRVQLR